MFAGVGSTRTGIHADLITVFVLMFNRGPIYQLEVSPTGFRHSFLDAEYMAVARRSCTSMRISATFSKVVRISMKTILRPSS